MSGDQSSASTGVAIAGRDGSLVLHTPGFIALLDLGGDVAAPGRRLDDIVNDLRATHPSVERLPSGTIRCITRAGRTMDIAFEKLTYDRMCVCVRDISEQREIENELRRAQSAAESASQAKSRFLATMSHELRTPLNAVIGFSDALMREAATPAGGIDKAPPMDRVRTAEFAGAIQQAGQNLLNLINNILDVARIESGRFDLAADLIDLPHMLQGCVRQAGAAAQSGEIKLELAVRPGMPRLRGDERRLRQVVNHLLSNAMKFTHAGGKVLVSVEIAVSRNLLIHVGDTGIGIAAEDIERVFEPFHQVDTGLARRAPGAGIGLYFCRALIQAHSGTLKLDSKPGAGTVATIELPHTRLITAPATLELLQEAP